MLPFQLASSTICRVARTGRVWQFTDWKYLNTGKDGGRWDEPQGTYRVRYVALEPVGALVENLQKKRLDLTALAEQQEVEGPEDPIQPIMPLSWFRDYQLGSAQLVLKEVELADLTTGEEITEMAPGVLAAQRACKRSPGSLDATTLMSTDP